MGALKLPYPARLEEAVPANLRCGRPARPEPAPQALPLLTGWAPVQLSSAAIPEVSCDWVLDHAPEVHIIDVRGPDEYGGELGHLETAELVPLSVLESGALTFDRALPQITVCRSGGRSGKAALYLLGLGFRRVASLAGGMRAWRAGGRPVAYGPARGRGYTPQG
jgi:rhodanese-related sulfurtransferase